MTTDLQNFIAGYIDLSEEEMKAITGKFSTKSIKRNTFLLRQGQTCKDFIFVQKGCLRTYILKDGIEISVWFAFPNSIASEIYSFIAQMPSDYFVQAVEDCQLLCISKSALNELYKTHPQMQEMMRKFCEDVLLHLIDRFSALQNDSAEERYLKLLANPEYLQMIPQKYLASFIGVTPTSLSRIRKSIK